MFELKGFNCNFVREPLIAPFGFKGGYLNELWQTVVRADSDKHTGVGTGVQSVLWSDSSVFSSYSQSAGNMLMFLITERGEKLLTGQRIGTPIDALEYVCEDVFEYAKGITCNKNLRKTFVLNALVAVDNALWQLYAKELGTDKFMKVVPTEFRDALAYNHEKLGAIPLITYGLDEKSIRSLLDEGHFILKIKIGSDPEHDNDLDKMLAWDKERLGTIHKIAGEYATEYTDNGKIAYYIDANGRYDSVDRIKSFLDYADKIGALSRIVLLEEPFAEDNKLDVSDLPCRIAADESAHSAEDVRERIELGYTAIALKPIAKTLSETLKILREADRRNVACFCADLTVNPIMAEINKNVAARIAPIPGLKIGVVEVNGGQNYRNWDKMFSYHPLGSSKFARPQNGVYVLDNEFYEKSGGIYMDSEYYDNIVR